jgi:Golgi phosphoprotein 3 (GPP34)
MTTPRDLVYVAIDVPSGPSVEQGDMSLALAGAELADLLAAEALTLDGDLILPGLQPELGDRLLDEAAASLTRQSPYESVEDWLWRRGRGLYAAYLAAFEAEGLFTRQRRRLLLLPAARATLADSPARRHAATRLASGDPVLTTLAAAAGIPTEPSGLPTNEAVGTVLATVEDAITELRAVRHRRSIEDSAFDNIWRGG